MGLSSDQNALNRPDVFKKAALYFILPFLFTGIILFGFLAMEAKEEKMLHAAEQRSNIKLLISEVTNEFSIIASDLHLLASHHELKSFLETGEAVHLEGLQEEFVTFSRVLRRYEQVRLIDSAGVERLRVNTREGETVVVPADTLQNKGHRYYFKEIKALKKGTVYFSRSDLNVEHREIESPAIPTIRAGIALFGLSKQNRGILVSNFKMTHLLRHMNKVTPSGIGQYLLVGSNDFWLQKKPDEDRWQLLVRDKKHLAPKARLPEKVWEEVIQSDSGQFDINDGLVSTRSFNPAGTAGKHMTSEKNPRWQFVTIVPKDILYARSSVILRGFLIAYVFISLLLAGGSYIFARTTLWKETSERALIKSESKHKRLVETTPYGIQEIDTAGNILFGSTAYHKMLGYEEDELTGVNIQDLVTEEKQGQTMTFLSKLVTEQPEIAPYTDQQVKKDGTIIDLEIAWNYNRDDQDNIIGFISVVTDISERSRQEKEREALFEEMERKNAELEQFTYTVSHDLKSPLITIKGFLGLLEKDIASGKDVQIKDDIARISNAASRMKQLLEELLELSRIGRLMNPPQEVSLDNVAHEAVETIAGIVAENKITIEISPSLPIILGDALRIREVFQNLLENAIRFMGDQAHPTIQIGSKVLKGKAVIYVRDNGIGLDPKYFKTVFGLFKRLNPNIEGTGVGLTLVKRIVEVHNGEIWIESEGTGRGCTFCFTLPTINA